MSEERHRPGDEVQDVARVGSARADEVGILFDRHADAVFRFCFLSLGSVVDAEDAVSETFARVIRSPRHAAPATLLGDPDRAWLFGIARNVVRELRRYRRRHRTEPMDTVLEYADLTSLSPADHATTATEIAAMRAALSTLREEQQQVLLLRFVAGLSSEETAKILGKSAGAVRVQQLRALKSLRERLGPNEVETGSP